ncbi:phage replisome organizer N-terminal domain-containing protein [Streptococcus suis]|uniref:phage replisome organizer N-terminal domain-containing protein n=1 Tax=Streptococcus suis TaxID=1307 RepID=UPI002AB55B75|nr:phage replisome organizer N-terminal domain-containing protein [Streptococcus suis]MDY7603041.1 phage replisome organizer N-terminal domain-containing protein [Streptococcus suis]
MASEIKWIKIVTDIFDDEKILLIESLPEADTIIVVWFKLLTLAGKQNYGGVLMMNDRVHYTDEMLSTLFRRPLNTVRAALQTFEQFGMIEIINNAITIPNWEKHQSVESMERVREQARKRVAKHREKQKTLANGNVTCNVTVTHGNALDKEEEIDKEEDIYNICPIKEIIEYLNSATGKSYRYQSNSNKKIIQARWNEGYKLDDFKKVIDNMVANWTGTEWEKYLQPSTLFRESNFDKYLNMVPRVPKTNIPDWALEEIKQDNSEEAMQRMQALKARMLANEKDEPVPKWAEKVLASQQTAEGQAKLADIYAELEAMENGET